MSPFYGVCLIVSALALMPTPSLSKHPHPCLPVRIGLGSWYGAHEAGRRMANGKPFEPRALTAASRTLPLGSEARVTNLLSGQSVLVTITDRGPYVWGRILDVSIGAAEVLRMRHLGVVPVRIEPVCRDAT